jgi:DNA-binding MurR/RpiR family transcriptional regulator
VVLSSVNRSHRRPNGGSEAGDRHLLRRLEDAFYLPSALARVAQFMVENPEKVVHLSLTEVSRRAQSGQASVVRLCHQLGFDGFTDFKLALAADLALRQSVGVGSRDAPADPLDRVADLVGQSVKETGDRLDRAALGRVAGHLLTKVRIEIFGSGVSGLVAELVAYRLLRLGLNAHTMRDDHLAQEVATGLGSSAAAIAISQSGVSPGTVEFVRSARAAGAFTVAVTCHPRAAVGRAADVVLEMARLRDPAYGGHLVDVPRTILVAEALAIAVSEARDAIVRG